MGTTNNYNWETEFDTSKNTMTHTLENGVKVVVLFAFKTIKVHSGDSLINTIEIDESWTIEEHIKYLCGLSENS